jgi:hypothetical protein
MVWDESGARYYETGVSKGILWTPTLLAGDGVGVPWNGLVAVNLDPQGGDVEQYYYDGVKYMNRLLAEDFQASIQAISTPSAFRPCEGDREFAAGVMTSFNKRDKFHMAWRTEIGSDTGESVGYKWHIAYNNLVQPAGRNYQTISDSSTMDVRTFTITATPACGRNSYFWFDSRDYDLSALEAQLYAGTLPMCYELGALVAPIGEDIPPLDPDLGCINIIENLEDYVHGQVVNDVKSVDGSGFTTEDTVQGLINDGLDIIELPAVGAFAANDSAASEVGTGDILADDDDATYITSADGDLGYTVALPPLVGYVDGCAFELHIRMSISGGVNPDDPDNLDADAQVHISTDATGDDTIGGFSDGEDEGMGFALSPVDGTPQDYVVPLSMDAWVDSTIDDVVTALEAGAYLNVVGATNNNTDTTPVVRVYEASVVMLNDTDPDKWLRTDDPVTDGIIEQHVYDVGTTDDVVGANSVYVDFKVMERAQNDDCIGFECVLMDWVGDIPGKLEVDIDSVAMLTWFDESSLFTSVATVVLAIDVWYQAVVDWSWGSYRIRAYKRDVPQTYVIDETGTSSTDPVAAVVHHAGYTGDVSKTYEVAIDNARMQMHCNDEAPPADIIIDLPAVRTRNIGGGIDGTVGYLAANDASEFSIPPADQVGVLQFGAGPDESTAANGVIVNMPATPAGYYLYRAQYVAEAYADHSSGTINPPDWSAYTPTPTTSPLLNLESSGTSNNYALDLPTGGYSGEQVWGGSELLTRLTAAVGSQLPANRLWNEYDTFSSGNNVHIKYYAIRLTYRAL